MLADEGGDARLDLLSPTPPVEDAVVTYPGLLIGGSLLRGQVGAEIMRGKRLAWSGNIIQLTLDGEKRSLANRFRPDWTTPPREVAVGQETPLKNPIHRLQVVVGRHIHNRQILVIEAAMRLRRFAIPPDEVMKHLQMRLQVPGGIHRNEAPDLEEAWIDAPSSARIVGWDLSNDRVLEPAERARLGEPRDRGRRTARVDRTAHQNHGTRLCRIIGLGQDGHACEDQGRRLTNGH